jgi:hypothetical protein
MQYAARSDTLVGVKLNSTKRWPANHYLTLVKVGYPHLQDRLVSALCVSLVVAHLFQDFR